MINPVDHKEKDNAAQEQHQVPDSTTALCETLVSKLTEKDDKPKPKKIYTRSDKDDAVEISDSSESDKDSDDDDEDDESDWSSATASPAPLKTPRAFEKSDHLYEKKMEKKKARNTEIEDWSWESERTLPEERPISKEVNVIQTKSKN